MWPSIAAAAPRAAPLSSATMAAAEAGLQPADTCGGSVRGQLAGLFRQALGVAFPAAGVEPAVVACAAKDAKNGDYQCNNAMALFAKLKGTPNPPKAPRDVSTAIIAALPANSVISETSIAGPGFINIRVSKDFLSKRISAMLVEGLGSWAPPTYRGKRVRRRRCHRGSGRTGRSPMAGWLYSFPAHARECALVLQVIVDFSSPNVAKEMHVGHLRSTIIGAQPSGACRGSEQGLGRAESSKADAANATLLAVEEAPAHLARTRSPPSSAGDTLSRVLEYCGADVLRLNHVGDWGTQFGMLIEHMADVRKARVASGGEDRDSDEDVSDLQVGSAGRGWGRAVLAGRADMEQRMRALPASRKGHLRCSCMVRRLWARVLSTAVAGLGAQELYRAAKRRFDEEEEFKTRAREAVTRLQSGAARGSGG